MAEFTLSAEKREELGKGPSRRLRVAGKIPAVFYNAKGDNIAIQVQEMPLMKLHEQIGTTKVFDLEVKDGDKTETYPTLIWDFEMHPYKRQVTHVDFYGIDSEKKVRLNVGLKPVGANQAIKLGGILSMHRDMLEVECLPADIPEIIEVDITKLGFSESIHVSEIPLPEGVATVYDHNFAVLSMSAPKGGASEDGEEGEE